MTPNPSTNNNETGPTTDVGDRPGTIQVLIKDTGNRQAISTMLTGHFDVETSQSVTDADLYLVEDKLLDSYRDTLREQVERSHPLFCPVVLVRRDSTRLHQYGLAAEADESTLRIDDFVDAPIDQALLIRRLRSLLGRRWQSQDLVTHMSALEDRERDLRQFERAVEDTGNPIALIDPDGTIDYVNPAFEAMTGYTETDAVGQTLRLLQSAESGTEFDAAFWHTMHDREEWEGEVVAERKNATECVLDTTITTIRNEAAGVEGYVAVLRDTTERIQREQTLQNREQELDLLRQILTRYLRHNLRNDLNVIEGYAELVAANVSEETAQYAETIVETTNQLLETSDTARRYSTLIERDGHPSQYDLATIVTEAATEIGERYPDVSIDVDSPEPCPIVAREGIREAITGLIDNAAQYNDAASPWIRIRVRQTDGTSLTIEDNGPGIPDHDLRAFEQGHESPLMHSSGIGVWLSKWVIEGLGGQLSFDNTTTGTRVKVSLPPPDAIPDEGLDISGLKSREQRLQTLIGRMTDGIIEVDDSWEITFLDTRAEEILEMDAEMLVDRPFWDVFSDVQETRFEAVCRDVMDSRESASVEEYSERFDAWLKIHVYPDFNGGLSFYFDDITARRDAEQHLTETRTRYQRILEHMSDFVIIVDDSGIVSYASPGIERVTGYEPETVVGANAFDFIISEDQDVAADAFAKTIENPDQEVGVNYRMTPMEGPPIWIEARGRNHLDDPVIDGVMVNVREITERKERELEVEQLNERFQALTRHSTDTITVIDEDGTIQYESPSVERILGWAPEELVGENTFDYVHPDDHERVLDTFLAAVEADKPMTETVQYRFKAADGSWVWLESVGSTRTDSAIKGYVINSRDITERREREQTAQAREDALQRAYEIIADGDRSLSRQIDDLLAVGREVIGTDYATFSHIQGEQYEFEAVAVATGIELQAGTTTRREELPICERVYESGQPLVVGDVQREVPELDDPAWGIACYLGVPVVVDGEPYGTFCFYDVEARADGFSSWERTFVELLGDWVGVELTRQQVGDRLQQQNEQLDDFASVVSHDLQNPLNLAQGRLDLAREESDSEHLDDVAYALNRMETLVEDLLARAQRVERESEFDVVECPEAVEECWRTIETGDATVNLAVTGSLRADPGRFYQLLENLLGNAVRHGGDAVTVTVGSLDGGFYVADDGPGIPADKQDDVFTAGYSSAEEGAGLGLSIVRDIAEDHDWTIDVTTSENGGARIEITGVTFVE